MNHTQNITLEAVANDFAVWRNNKKFGERVPEVLWQKVKVLSRYYRAGLITKTLQISGGQYRRCVIGLPQPNTQELATSASNVFVKIKNPLRQHSAYLRLELVRKDGVTLNCYYSNMDMLHSTMKWFMEE